MTRREHAEPAVHPILITLSVGEPFWVLDRDLRSLNVKLGAGSTLQAYLERPQCYGAGNDGLTAWVNPDHVVCAVLFPAIPRAKMRNETE